MKSFPPYHILRGDSYQNSVVRKNKTLANITYQQIVYPSKSPPLKGPKHKRFSTTKHSDKTNNLTRLNLSARETRKAHIQLIGCIKRLSNNKLSVVKINTIQIGRASCRERV